MTEIKIANTPLDRKSKDGEQFDVYACYYAIVIFAKFAEKYKKKNNKKHKINKKELK